MSLLRQRVDHGTARRKEREEDERRRKLPTPHPWKWVDKSTDEGGEVNVSSLVSGDGSEFVAYGGVCQGEGTIVITNEADAELIRSAPELKQRVDELEAQLRVAEDTIYEFNEQLEG